MNKCYVFEISFNFVYKNFDFFFRQEKEDVRIKKKVVT